MSETIPYSAEGFIARTKEELVPSQKSKYCPTPLNSILKQFIYERSDERFVFVGLPSHVHGLRLLQRAFPHLTKTIPLVVSTFTAHIPTSRATEFILRANKINPECVKHVEYRGGGVPGRFCAQMNDGTERYVPHLHWTYSGHAVPNFFYTPREWLYFDKMSNWADVSMGDNWYQFGQHQKGFSTIVTRSIHSEQLVRQMIQEGVIHADEISPEDLVEDQGLRKKLDIGIRVHVWRKLGFKTPIYNPPLPVTMSRFFETLRFAIYVWLGNRRIPFPILKLWIFLDYRLRSGVVKPIMKKCRHALGKAIRLLCLPLPERTPLPLKQHEKKVVFIGGYGYKDIGDEAMPHADLLKFREHFGDRVEFCFLSVDPKFTAQSFGCRSVGIIHDLCLTRRVSFRRRISFLLNAIMFLAGTACGRFGYRPRLPLTQRRVIDELMTADLLFNVGGGNINSITTTEIYQKLLMHTGARLLGKPVVLSGQTIGPFYGWFDRAAARCALNNVQVISFRDKNESQELCEIIGVTKPMMFDAADDAITLPDSGKVFAERELSELGIDVRRTDFLCCMNMKASLRVFKGKGRLGGLSKEIEILAAICRRLIDEKNATVFFLPTDYTVGVDDRDVHREIASLVGRDGRVFLVEKEYKDIELKALIGVADLALGARYHFNVFAAACYTPFIGIASGEYQRKKLRGLSNLCELPSTYIDVDLEFCELNVVWPAIEQVCDTRIEVREQLEKRIPSLKQASYRTIELAGRLMGLSNR